MYSLFTPAGIDLLIFLRGCDRVTRMRIDLVFIILVIFHCLPREIDL